MDYVAYPETTLVPSGVTTGSMTVHKMPKLIKFHAVARDDNGKMRAQAECGMPTRFGPEEAEPQLWDAIHVYRRCLNCAQATGVNVADEYTGQIVYARQH
jgi:hypothetical protein